MLAFRTAIVSSVALLCSCSWLIGAATEEVVDTVLNDGVRVLRSPLRPTRGTHRVLLFAVDGVGRFQLNRALREGRIPQLTSWIGPESGPEGVYEHAYEAQGALSILPSTTMAAWTSVYTGEPPARSGIPGNEWFERRTGRFLAPAPASLHGLNDTLAMLNEGLLHKSLRVPTLYERAGVRSYVSMAPIYRGADIYTSMDTAGAAEMFGSVVEGVVGEESVAQQGYREMDENSVDVTLDAIEQHGLADLQVVYFPGIDLFTHRADPPLQKQLEFLEQVIGPAMGEVLDAYRREDALADTTVLVLSDHGHTPVEHDDAHALSSKGPNEPPEVLRHMGFRVRPFELEIDDDERNFQAAVAYQGAMAYVYLADRSTCPEPGSRCKWSEPPRYDQDVLPVARAFFQANAEGKHVKALQGTLDLIFARRPRPLHEPSDPFAVFDGTKLVPIAEYLDGAGREDLLELELRMRQLSAGPVGHRAGDLLLMAKSGMHRPKAQRHYFSTPYRSWHGSAHPQDSEISFLLAHQRVSGGELRDIAKTFLDRPVTHLQVVPLVLALLQSQ